MMEIIGIIFITAVVLVPFIAALIQVQRLGKTIAERDKQLAIARQESDGLRQEIATLTSHIQRVGTLVVERDKQLATAKQESERCRQHYEDETLRIRREAETSVSTALEEVESLRKYQGIQDVEQEANRLLGDARAEAQHLLAVALTEAKGLQAEAQTLLEQSRRAAADERSAASQRAKNISEQADALLNQATRDAGRIMAEAEKRAEQIGGDAYRALREKDQLEQAANAMRNVVEGYGDRYLVPTHSLLDDLAEGFGYAAAGESLKSARDLSRRMVEQGEAATCEYVEASRRTTAIQFVIHAFNGRVDATLSRVKYDNYGTLEQEIRDAFSLVNKDGKAFRNACILPAYLDARLAELKWGVTVQELARQRQEEQRYAKQQARDEEKARRESERAIREAKKEEELLRMAEEEARHEHEKAMAELSARLERASQEQRAELQKTMEEQKAKFESQLQQKDEEIRLAEEKSQRAISNAQRTKHGHVYIISNIGSFKEDVFKIGLTRRDNWQERIDELGDASVPFEFDVHGIIESDNAPELESRLQARFLALRVNKQNRRKEFFRVKLKEIIQEVDKLKQGEDYIGNIHWTEDARAKEWRETRHIESSPEKLKQWLTAEGARTLLSPEFDTVSSFNET
ncbi:MAG: DUF4041 domain-containing protein [Verrucomicrobia bacterium]|nr:DUF4041 domain-containing protein [Verrucomicrobiota bacterium]